MPTTPRLNPGSNLAVALWLALASPAAQSAETLRLCGSASTTLPDEAWRAAGVTPGPSGSSRDAFVAALLSRYSGLPTAVIFMPSRRCISETAAGRLDAIVGLSALPERTAIVRYPMRDGQLDREQRLNTHAYYWYVRAGAPWRWDGRTLSGGEGRPPLVGVEEGHSVASLLRRDGWQLHAVSGGSVAALRMLERQRFDIAVLLDIEVSTAMDKAPDLGRQLVRLEPPYSVRDYYLVLSPALVDTRPDIARKLWDAVPRVRELTQRLHIDMP